MNCDFLPYERAKICILQEVTSERCNSDQLNTFFITSTYRHPLVMKKVFNWSELHLSEVTSYKIHTLVCYHKNKIFYRKQYR